MIDKMTLRKDVTITLATIIPANRHLVIDLPADAPTGPAEVRISIPLPTNTDKGVNDLSSLDELRTQLLAAGRLVEFKAPENIQALSDEELFELTDQLAGGSSVDEIMKDIRGEW